MTLCAAWLLLLDALADRTARRTEMARHRLRWGQSIRHIVSAPIVRRLALRLPWVSLRFRRVPFRHHSSNYNLTHHEPQASHARTHPNTPKHALGNGYSLRIKIYADEHHDAPWDSSEGHGPVTDWETRDKRPGEWILSESRNSYRFYDAAEAIRHAWRYGWGLDPDDTIALVRKLKKADSSELTRGEIIAEAVRLDYAFLKGWCDDEWHYLEYKVDLIHEDEEGEVPTIKELDTSCWGFESTKEGREDMLGEAISQAEDEAKDFLQSIFS